MATTPPLLVNTSLFPLDSVTFAHQVVSAQVESKLSALQEPAAKINLPTKMFSLVLMSATLVTTAKPAAQEDTQPALITIKVPFALQVTTAQLVVRLLLLVQLVLTQMV